MKINRISESMGLISDEISSRAIEAFEKKSENQSSISEEKPRVIREEKSHKAPFVIALAGLCAAAAVVVPLVLKNAGNSSITSSDVLSGAADSVVESVSENVSESAPQVEKLEFDRTDSEDSRIEFTIPEYEGVTFEWKRGGKRDGILANGEIIAEGMPVLQAYLADLNGDGMREIVTSSSWGSGFTPQSIGAYDYANKQFYVFHSSDYFNNFYLYTNNDELWVRERDYLGNNVLSDKKLELSDMKLYEKGPEVAPEEWYSGFEPELTADTSIAVNVREVKISLNDDGNLIIRDDENPNVKIFSIKFDCSKANAFAFVINKDGTYKTFSGDDITKEEILRECPDGVFGDLWSSKIEWGLFNDENTIWAFNGSHDCTEDNLWTYEFWFALDDEALRTFEEFAPEGFGGGLRIKDNGDGTYSIISAPYNS